MISTFISEHYGLVQAILLVAAIACVVLAGFLVTRRRVAAALAAVGVIVVFALTLAPDTFANPDVGCNFQSVTPLGDERNIALFFLPTLFAFIAVRRPVLVALGGIVLSAAIEFVQAITPVIGRRCDIDDWLANSAGAVAGVLVGLLVVLVTNRLRRKVS